MLIHIMDFWFELGSEIQVPKRLLMVIALILCLAIISHDLGTTLWSNGVLLAYTKLLLGKQPAAWLATIRPWHIARFPHTSLSQARYALLVNANLEGVTHFPAPDQVPDPMRRWQWGLLAEQFGDQDGALAYWNTETLQATAARLIWRDLQTAKSEAYQRRLSWFSAYANLTPEACFYVSLAFSELKDWHSASRYAYCAARDSIDLNDSQLSLEYYSESNAYFQLGWSLEQLGNFTEAQSAYQQSVNKNPRNDRGWQRLGWVTYKFTQQLEPALSYYAQAFEINPLAEYQLDVADLYRLTGHYALALQWAQTAADAGAPAGAALARARIFLDIDQPANALQAALDAFERGKRNPDVYLLLGDAYFELQAYPEAIDAYNKLLEFDSLSVMALTRIARAYINNGQPEDALLVLYRASEITQDPNVLQMILELMNK